MNSTPSEGMALIGELKSGLTGFDKVEVIIAPPFTHLYEAGEALKGSSIMLAAQNFFPKDSGAYTGEISVPMLKDIGCRYVIVGHSERRQYFGETDNSVNEKVVAALEHGITPIVCMGETLDERESGKALEVIKKQFTGGLKGLSGEDSRNIMIAYEPVWAIGTGRTATDEQAQEVHSFIRDCFKELFGSESAASVRVLYGGSVKPDNIEGLMTQPDIDGALVGGASLKAESFIKIVKFEKG